MKRIAYFLLFSICCLAACESNIDNVNNEYADWKVRNEKAFMQKVKEVDKAISMAKAQYGKDWMSHSPYRKYRNFMLNGNQAGKPSDSVYVEIIKSGNGMRAPIYTDSVKVRYIGRLIPTESNPSGKIFDHTGISREFDAVFDERTGSVASFVVGHTVPGYSTALQHMREGDLWRIFIPYESGYGNNSPSDVIPAYSMLTFDLQLVKIIEDSQS